MMLGITLGDPCGVGPEILLRTFARGELRHPAVVYGDRAVLSQCATVLGLTVPIRTVEGPRDYQPGAINLIDHGLLDPEDITPGVPSERCGAAARQYIDSATQAALEGHIAAIVTLPVNKKAIQLSDPSFTGHTELIASLCGQSDATIMLVSDQLIVTHISTHMALAEAIRRVRRERIQRVIALTAEAVFRLRGRARIAVAGLNPHAGESGLFGSEEIEEIAPAVEWARQQGLCVEGPLPPDTVFHLAVRRQRFDAVVCMYHDQGHIPLKLLDFEGGVNVTLGLPIVRTSVDHGTAYDIAWQGLASNRSFLAALELAAKLAPTAT